MRQQPILKIFLTCLILSVLTPIALADHEYSVHAYDGSDNINEATIIVIVDGQTHSAMTNSLGIANFTLPDGEYYFRISKEGYIPITIKASTKNDLIQAHLEKLYGISGKVINSITEKPLKDASITISSKTNNNIFTGTTDDNGIFNIKTPEDYYGITIRAPYHTPLFTDNHGAGYHIQNNDLYIGYLPLTTGNTDTNTDTNGIKLVCDYPGKTVKVNESVSYDIRIINNGGLDKTLLLTIKESPPDWNVKFITANDEIDRVFIEKGTSKSITVKTIPLTEGQHSITITAASPTDNCSLQLYVNSQKDKDYKLELYTPNNISLNSGTNQDIEVTIKNNGSTKLTNLRIEINEDDTPSSLTANIQSKNINELGPGESKRLTVKIYAKADTSTTTDKLYLKAISTETKTDYHTINVNIQKSETWIGVGIGIAIIAILSFGFIVWKYGRR